MWTSIEGREFLDQLSSCLSASQTGLTERRDDVSCNPALDTEGTGFKCRPMDGLSWRSRRHLQEAIVILPHIILPVSFTSPCYLYADRPVSLRSVLWTTDVVLNKNEGLMILGVIALKPEEHVSTKTLFTMWVGYSPIRDKWRTLCLYEGRTESHEQQFLVK